MPRISIEGPPLSLDKKRNAGGGRQVAVRFSQ